MVVVTLEVKHPTTVKYHIGMGQICLPKKPSVKLSKATRRKSSRTELVKGTVTSSSTDQVSFI